MAVDEGSAERFTQGTRVHPLYIPTGTTPFQWYMQSSLTDRHINSNPTIYIMMHTLSFTTYIHRNGPNYIGERISKLRHINSGTTGSELYLFDIELRSSDKPCQCASHRTVMYKLPSMNITVLPDSHTSTTISLTVTYVIAKSPPMAIASRGSRNKVPECRVV